MQLDGCRADNRTLYEAQLDVKYGWRFNEMNARLYRHLDLAFGFVGLFGGSAALISAIGEYKTTGVVAGAMIAAFAIIERLVRPIEKAVAHDEAKRKYNELSDRSRGMTLDELDRDLGKLQTESPSGFAALSVPAYNTNLVANGRPEYAIMETRWEKLFAFLA